MTFKENHLVTQIINSLLEIISNYDAFLVDLWGVTHNGKAPFPGAIDCFQEIKNQDKKVILLSNAPRMPEAAIQRLTEMGVPRDLYVDLYTSGYECHLHLKERSNDFYQSLGSRLHHIGPERDRNLFESLDYLPVQNAQEADFLLVTGTDTWESTLEDYEPTLQQALEKGLPLACANSDKKVMFGEDIVICSGAIASRYQELGGKVYQHGKPNSSVYKEAHLLANKSFNTDINKTRLLMIGDSLATDIAGANAYEIDSLMVLSGIHGAELLPAIHSSEEFKSKSKELFSSYNSSPTFIADKLAC